MSAELEDFYNAFLPESESVTSMPLKGPKFAVKPMKSHVAPRSATARSVAAVAAAAAAARSKLAVGDLVPRRFEEPSGVIENGAASDIIRAGLAIAAVTSDGAEAFRLTPSGVKAIRDTVPAEVFSRHFD